MFPEFLQPHHMQRLLFSLLDMSGGSWMSNVYAHLGMILREASSELAVNVVLKCHGQFGFFPQTFMQPFHDEVLASDPYNCSSILSLKPACMAMLVQREAGEGGLLALLTSQAHKLFSLVDRGSGLSPRRSHRKIEVYRKRRHSSCR